MKPILEAFASMLAILIIIYIPFAFILNNWNPLTWNIYTRCLYMLSFLALLTYGIELYKKK